MSKKSMKIAVLGCGFGGLGSILMLKEEGFDPICFEKTDQVGGTWCYREKAIEGVGSTMPTTIINHSKEMGAISNCPPPKEYNNYMRHSELYQYITNFADERDLMRHVRLNHEVVCCKRAEDYEDTGRWLVTVRNTISGVETTDTYDAVVVSVGHINRSKIPVFPGMEEFKGKIVHTHELKGVSEYKGQDVVIVGMGCSALDAAVEISRVAKQVYLSTKSGTHVISRVGPHGYPIDYSVIRRYFMHLFDILPAGLLGWLFQKLYIDPIFDSKLYAVEPISHVFAKDPVQNDHISSRLLSGAVLQKRNISRFTETGVVFDSEDHVTNADSVIMGTGYDWKFPFLEDGIVVQEKDLQINLYKCIWPPHLKHATLAFVGFFLPFGPGFPVGELQTRYIAQVFAGNVQLPPVDAMMKEIQKRHSNNVKRYLPDDKISLKVDYIQFCDSLASEIGAKPNFLKLLFTDFPLFWKLVFGPSVSYQYRLQGPHKWDGAREAIMTVDERLHFPLHRGKKQKRPNVVQNVLNWLCSWFFGLFKFETRVIGTKNK
ncbi:hypothetical protein JTE90_006545 [Oedothorax gibbosus]|uniref:Flavin-containing monooxygenase n=1 Tax=Oedothorax gibbosus TaxID=931172 RepID=A0AAV6VIJ9_9ARAC|nr:hypothetical protein JTE90_006545 [Oedothorax gibbosus]